MTSGAPTRMAAWLESAWLARYLERQLDGEELAWFEAYLLDKPELLGMVEADNALRDGLAEHSSVTASESSQGNVPIAKRDRRFPLALVASLVIGVGLGLLGRHPWQGESMVAAIVANPDHIVFDTVRGIDQPAANADSVASSSPYVLVDIAVPGDAVNIFMEIGRLPPFPLRASADGFVSFLWKRSSSGPLQATVRYEVGERKVSKSIEIN